MSNFFQQDLPLSSNLFVLSMLPFCSFSLWIGTQVFHACWWKRNQAALFNLISFIFHPPARTLWFEPIGASNVLRILLCVCNRIFPKHKVISEGGFHQYNEGMQVLCDILFHELCLFVGMVSGKLCKQKKESNNLLENTSNVCTIWDLGCTTYFCIVLYVMRDSLRIFFGHK